MQFSLHVESKTDGFMHYAETSTDSLHNHECVTSCGPTVSSILQADGGVEVFSRRGESDQSLSGRLQRGGAAAVAAVLR